jgi:Asp-tRNA(Asn)/Glu-tRNA(Gln) amidotransferase A subunit family amidase
MQSQLMQSLVDLRRAIEAGSLTPEDAIARSRHAIDKLDAGLRAFTCLASPDAVVPRHGPLAGIAVGVKDIIDTATLPTQMGCPAIYGDWRPRADAAIVSMLRAAGGFVAGKTETTPFAFLDPAPTLNPHDAARTPGGSSSGSAAAVAAGLVPLAFGTQTGGSVIRPASFCGVAAFKPSFRLLPMVGVKTYAWALDTLGLFAAGVADLAYAMSALTGRDLLRPATDPASLRVAVIRQSFAGDAEPEGERALDKAARALERAGASIVAIELPEACAKGHAAHRDVQDFEARHALAWEWRERRDDLPPLLGAALDRAQHITPADYDEARRMSRHARSAIKDVFADTRCDVILTYSAPGPAPDRATTGDPRFNKLFTLLGTPCVNVPANRGEALPIGVQLVGPFARDAETLAAALTLEQALQRD